jgi:hypothetical protein
MATIGLPTDAGSQAARCGSQLRGDGDAGWDSMKYRGIEYRVVQTIDGGFRWSVQISDRESVGTQLRRADAIHRAERFIDEAIGKDDGAAETKESAN